MTRFEKVKAALAKRRPKVKNRYALASYIIEEKARREGKDPKAALARAKEE